MVYFNNNKRIIFFGDPFNDVRKTSAKRYSGVSIITLRNIIFSVFQQLFNHLTNFSVSGVTFSLISLTIFALNIILFDAIRQINLFVTYTPRRKYKNTSLFVIICRLLYEFSPKFDIVFEEKYSVCHYLNIVSF